METKKCLTCGAEMDVNAIKCPSCGASKGRKKPMPKSHLAWAIFSTLFCCLPTGIVSIVYAAKVSKTYQQGNIVEAYRKSKLADRWANIGAFIAFIPLILYILVNVLGVNIALVSDILKNLGI